MNDDNRARHLALTLCSFEIDLLKKIRDDEPLEWGAAVGAGLGSLRGNGCITDYLTVPAALTELGQEVLKRWEAYHA